MEPQVYSWTCSICSFTWVMNATGIDPILTRQAATNLIGYPYCVNETYGLMSTQCLIDSFAAYGVKAKQAWVTYDEAWAICAQNTGVLNGLGWYHFVAIRGISGDNIWVANSAPGYRGVWEILDRSTFNNLGPFQIVYLVS